jgi:phage terminase small subunit
VQAYLKLKRRQQRFVDAYVECGVGKDAFLAIMPKSKRPDDGAWNLLCLPEIKQAVAERTEVAIAKAGVRLVRILEEAANLAQFNPKDLRDAEGKLIPMKDLPRHVAAAIASEEFDENGVLRKYRTYPKNESIKLLLQHLGALIERHEHTGKDGAPIQTEEKSDLEKARRIAFMLTQGIRSAQATAPDPQG